LLKKQKKIIIKIVICTTEGKNNNNNRVERKEMTLLGSPISEGKAQDAAIMHMTDELQKADVKRLALL